MQVRQVDVEQQQLRRVLGEPVQGLEAVVHHVDIADIGQGFLHQDLAGVVVLHIEDAQQRSVTVFYRDARGNFPLQRRAER
ncbi:hypothetical protein D3C85_1771510 [compost metagenome]